MAPATSLFSGVKDIPEAKDAPEVSEVSNSTAPQRKSKAPDFSVLSTHPEFLDLLRRYPRLKNELRKIYIETLPPAPRQHSQPGWNRNGRGGSSRPPPGMGTWNSDKGLKKATARIARSREWDGDDAEGVREFEQLIVKLYAPEKET
jgi:hypothetical protein